ncbi:hypothetical protein PALB_27160 [Pseudoalteromonas luteoviolacea B = ATCC 29581]|nr:hypothetical protein PALB_27160 [Pseudoalteromonas luteoviolacea B = ATCC 29581]
MRYFFIFILLLGLPRLVAAKPLTVIYEIDNQLKVVSGKTNNNKFVFITPNKPTLKLVTLNWPPYIDQHLCNQGWVFQLTVAIFDHAGYSLEIEFLPWARAVREAELGKADVLFPEYYIEEQAPSDNILGLSRDSLLHLSSHFPGGAIHLIKRARYDFSFDGNLEQLENRLIGVVRGYQNTPEFDALMDTGKLNTIEAVDDFQLIKLLMNERVDLIVGDPEVIRSSIIISNNIDSSQKQKWMQSLELVEPPLAYNPLYFAISKRVNNNQQILKNINRSLADFTEQNVLIPLITKAKDHCSMPRLPL